MGRSAYVYKNYDKAREMFLKDIEQHDRGDSYYFLGEIEKTEKNYDLAMTYFQGAIERNTTRKYLVNAYWNLIILHEEKGDYSNVVKYCRMMWQKTGDSSAKKKIESLTNKLLWTSNADAIVRYENGMENLNKGNKDEALKLFREALTYDSLFLAPKFELGMYAYKNGNESEALNYLEPIAERIPYYTEVQLIVANINYNNRNFNRAAARFTSVIDSEFSDRQTITDATLKRGICWYNMGDMDRAEQDISSVSANIKNNAEPLVVLAAIHIKKRNYDEALKVLSRAEAVSPDDPIILYQTGSIYYSRNDWKYVSYFDRLHDITVKKPPEDYSRYLKAFKLLAQAHFDKKNWLRAAEISESYLQNTNDYNITLLSGKSYFHMEKYDKSIEQLEKISLKYSDELYLAMANARTGRKEKSIAILKRIIFDPAIRREASKDSQLKTYIEEIDRQNNQNKTSVENNQASGGTTGGTTVGTTDNSAAGDSTKQGDGTSPAVDEIKTEKDTGSVKDQ
jgi:tetratricopeptide (TPR) repeat protein